MNITLCIPTLRRYDLLARAVASARAGNPPPDRVVVLDNGGNLRLDGVEVHRPGRNLGVAASWNWFLRHGEDWLVIANDDVVFHEDTLAGLVAAAEARPDQVFFCPGSGAGQAWSLFLQRRRSLEVVGPYDEEFWPAYFEDNDYAYRMKLAGQRENRAAGGYDHAGSSTLRAFSAEDLVVHHRRFEACREYYRRKWGNVPGQEVYTTPFNGLAVPVEPGRRVPDPGGVA